MKASDAGVVEFEELVKVIRVAALQSRQHDLRQSLRAGGEHRERRRRFKTIRAIDLSVRYTRPSAAT